VNRTGTPLLACSIAALIVYSASIALAADWPTFKPGNWTFERTMTRTDSTPDKLTHTKCTDPTADQKAQQVPTPPAM
jgi:hypothetical protein